MIAKHRRVVLDTNVLISRLVAPASIPAQAVEHVLARCELLLSAATIKELDEVFRRPKFDRYHDLDLRLRYMWSLVDVAKPIQVTHTVTDCRDPRDNKFLELALSGNADLIITGDADLLCLQPWRGIAILSPGDYLAQAG